MSRVIQVKLDDETEKVLLRVAKEINRDIVYVSEYVLNDIAAKFEDKIQSNLDEWETM